MIGIDIEYIPRFEKIYSKKKNMLKKIFNSSEWDYALKKSNTAQTLTGIWCAKEAVVKAISHKKEVFIIDIIIKHKKSGQPYVTFKKSLFNEELFAVSISHSKDYATAIAVFSEK